MKYQIGIIGGGGYTAGELLRILVHHPEVEIAFVQSQSQAGKPLYHTHTDLLGETELVFSAEAGEADVLFLCMGHGRSKTWMEEHKPSADTLVVDLSTDYRMADDWVYGLPEINGAQTQGAKRVANPGCFATAIQLGLLPLVKAGLADGEVHINGMTGSTGAGQSPMHAKAAFTHVTDRNPDLKQVVNTNKGIVFVEKHGDKALVISMIDNLLKGASGQAVQNMNLALGLPEGAGLGLKAGMF